MKQFNLPSANPSAAPIALHPLHAILLAFPVSMFPGALLADITYLNSSEMQESNFASWLIAEALVFTGPALAWALIGMLVRRARKRLALCDPGAALRRQPRQCVPA